MLGWYLLLGVGLEVNWEHRRPKACDHFKFHSLYSRLDDHVFQLCLYLENHAIVHVSFVTSNNDLMTI